MAVHELSVGMLYLAAPKIEVKRCGVRTVGIVQMCPPFREGRALLVPCWNYRAFAIGLWTFDKNRAINNEFEDDIWLSPHRLELFSPNEIGVWSAEEEASKEDD